VSPYRLGRRALVRFSPLQDLPQRFGRPRTHHLGRAESPGVCTSSGNVRPATTALASCSSRPSTARPLWRRVATSWNASRAISRSTHLGRALGYCLCCCEELIERWAYGAGRHGASVSAPHAPVSEYGGRSANAGSQACAPTVQQLLRRSVGPFGDRLLPRPPPECSLISTRRVVDVVLTASGTNDPLTLRRHWWPSPGSLGPAAESAGLGGSPAVHEPLPGCGPVALRLGPDGLEGEDGLRSSADTGYSPTD
jgi:hypothetical protein